MKKRELSARIEQLESAVSALTKLIAMQSVEIERLRTFPYTPTPKTWPAHRPVPDYKELWPFTYENIL